MNSKNLKKTYVNTYERFFLENEIVISTPFIMNWSGDILNNYSGVGIKQKIPLRLYAGCSKNSSGKITLGKVFNLDLNEYKFIETNALEYAPYFNDLNSYIEEKYAHLIKEYGGLEINILSELPRGVGLGFGSIIALLLAVLFNRLENKLDIETINELKKQNINNLLNDTYGSFYSMFMDALELDKHVYSMVSSSTKLGSFFDSYYPIVAFSQDFEKTSPHTDLHTNRYFGFRFQDIFKEVREVPYAPIDYGLIYSGKPVLLEQIAGSHYKNNGYIEQEIKTEFRTLFGDYLDQLSPNQRPRFYKNLIHPETNEFDLTYGKLMGIISLKVLYFMSQMYCDGYDESNMLQFLDAIKKLNQGDAVTRDSSHTFLSFIKKLLEKFQ
ncbi:TPA: hypothetical protein DEP21_02540 [Patescibacteria group bacterium]|nr:hypothetical protein [Candidatus Gracilibacteria bacterium]